MLIWETHEYREQAGRLFCNILHQENNGQAETAQTVSSQCPRLSSPQPGRNYLRSQPRPVLMDCSMVSPAQLMIRTHHWALFVSPDLYLTPRTRPECHLTPSTAPPPHAAFNLPPLVPPGSHCQISEATYQNVHP